MTIKTSLFFCWDTTGADCACAPIIGTEKNAISTIIKTKNTKGISLPMYILFTIGVACWLLYGIYFGMLPVIIANFITLALALVILTFKIKYK